MITKSGKHHFTATLVQTDGNGIECGRIEGYRFTAKDPAEFAEQLPHRFVGSKWTASFENLIDLDAEEVQ